MTTLVKRYGPWAVVTGASSGIGVEFATQLAKAGLNVVLVARRTERLEDLSQRLKNEFGVETRVVGVDLTRENFIEDVDALTGDLDVGLLVNNAGFANSGLFLDNELDAELELLSVNSRAPLILTHHFGQRIRKRESGGILFVASTVAFSGTPNWSNYAASKAYVMTL